MMDPYQVLGVSRNASDDEIKKAYRNLSRKYHPDANVNNPNKAEAEERFKQVQQAYDAIMKSKTGGADPFGFGSQGGYGGAGTRGSYNESDSRLQAAANYISNRYFDQALNVLDSIAFSERTGRWYFLSALAYAGQGNTAMANEHIQNAIRLEPNNIEYRQAQNYINNGGGWYNARSMNYGRAYNGGGGNWCMSMLLLNLLCHCCTPL